MDNRARLDTIIIDFAKAFDLVPHDQLLTKPAALGVELRVVVWKREFLLGRMQRESKDSCQRKLRVTSGVDST